MNPWDQFTGANAGYVYELFERYQRDPSSVDEETRRAFATWTPADPVPATLTTSPDARTASADLQAGIAAFNLADRKSTRLYSSHTDISRMPSSA